MQASSRAAMRRHGAVVTFLSGPIHAARRRGRALAAAEQMHRATRYAVEALEARTLLTAVSWVGSASGDYDDPTQWSSGAVPTAADDVTINAGPGITITHSAGIDAVNSLTSNNPFVLSGGALSVATTLTLTDTFTLTGGKLSNATVAGSPNELIATGAGTGASTLDNVTLNVDQTIGDGTVVDVFNSLTLNSVVLTIASDGAPTGVQFQNSPAQTLGGSGQILFAGTLPLNNIITINNQSGGLTIGSGITIHGSSGQIVANNVGGNPTLQGIIAADTAGQTITLSGGAFINTGTVEAINGGTLTDNAQMNGSIVENNSTLNIGYTVNSVPMLTRVGGTVNLTGVIDFFGGTMPFNSATGSWNFVGGIARNSHLTFSGTDSLVLTGSGGIFSNITLDSNLDLPTGASLTINNGLTLNNTTLSVETGATLAFDNLPSSGQTLGGIGDILLAGGVATTLDSTSAGLTVASGITIHGAGALSVQGNDVLQGTVSADVPGQTLSISGMNTVVQGTVQAVNGSTLDLGIGLNSAGVISETNATINFGGTYNALPTVVRSGGFLIMAGTLNLGDGFQVFDDTTGVWILTGTLQHGIISFAGAGGLVPGGLDPVFQSVTLNSDMTLPDGIRLIVQGDLTLNARLTIASDGLFTTLFFDGSGAVNLNGTGNVVFGGTVPATDVFTANACDLTIQANVSLFGAGGTLQTLAGGTLDLQGLVSVNSPGNTLVIQGTGIAFQGTLQAFGGTIDVQGDLPMFAVTFINVLLGPGFAGQINVDGNAALNGQLNVFLAAGYTPPQGSTFNVLTYQSTTGDFAGFSGLTSPGVVFTPSILPGAYVLNTTQGAPASPVVNLTLSGINDTPGAYRPGDTITASMSQNISASADVGAFDIQVDLSTDPFFGNADDIPLETIHVLGTPGTFRVDVSAFLPASASSGSYFLVASTDIGNVVAETNETDNTSSTLGADIVVQPPLLTPDLGTGLITYTPGTYTAGDAFNVPIGFSNFGATGTGPFEIDVVLSEDTVPGNGDDVVIERLSEPGFATAGSASITALATIPAGLLPGSYHVLVVLDPANAVSEANKGNNLFVSAMADVVIPAPPVPPTPRPVVVGGVNVNFGVNGLAGHSVGITTVADIALQPDGKSIIVGTGGPAGAQEFVLTRYTANGSIDRTFGNQGTVTTDFGGRDDKAAAVWLLPGGQFLVAGTSTRMAAGVAASSAFALARYNADGSLDTTFGQGTGEVLTSFGGDSAVSTSNDVAHALAVRADGAIFIAGSSDVSASGLEFAIAAFNSDGSLSQAFGNVGKILIPFAGGDASISAIAFAKGNALVAAGSFTNSKTGVTSMALSAMRANGAPNKTFGKNGQVTQGLRGIDDEATSVAIAPDGRIILGGLSVTGSATAGTLTTDFALVRFTTAGRVDKSFHRGQVITSFGQPTAITKILIEPSGKIVASGKTASSLSAVVPNQLGLALAQYNTNGSLDTTFNGTGKSILSLNGGTVAARPAGVVGASLVRAAAPSSDLLNKFDQLKQTAQGALATNQGGELFAIGNSGTDTVEAAVVANGVDLTGNSLALRGAVKTGKPATITFTLSNQGNVAMTGATAAQVFASSDQTLASGTMLTTISAIKLTLKGGASKPFTQKVTVPKSLAAGTYFLLLQLDPGNTLSELDLTNNLLVSGASFVVR